MFYFLFCWTDFLSIFLFHHFMLYFSRYQEWAVEILKNNYGDTQSCALSALIIIELVLVYATHMLSNVDTQLNRNCEYKKLSERMLIAVLWTKISLAINFETFRVFLITKNVLQMRISSHVPSTPNSHTFNRFTARNFLIPYNNLNLFIFSLLAEGTGINYYYFKFDEFAVIFRELFHRRSDFRGGCWEW